MCTASLDREHCSWLLGRGGYRLLFVEVALEWSNRFGDQLGWQKWVETDEAKGADHVSPTKVARDAIGRFAGMLDAILPKIAGARPDVVKWYNHNATEMINEAWQHARVRTADELVDVIGLVDELALLISDTEDPEDTCFWLVETLAQLRNSMRRLREEWDAAPWLEVDVPAESRRWWQTQISFINAVEQSLAHQRNEDRPEELRPVAFSMAF